MRFKATFANGASLVLTVADDATLDDLRALLCDKSSIAPQDQHGKARRRIHRGGRCERVTSCAFLSHVQ